MNYSDTDDMPTLYRLTADSLKLSPSQHTEQVFRQIVGGCQSVVEGLGAMQIVTAMRMERKQQVFARLRDMLNWRSTLPERWRRSCLPPGSRNTSDGRTRENCVTRDK